MNYKMGTNDQKNVNSWTSEAESWRQQIETKEIVENQTEKNKRTLRKKKSGIQETSLRSR